MVQKIYLKIHPVSCTNTNHDVTDFVNHRMVKNTKTWLSWENNISFLWNKKCLTCASDYTFGEVIVLQQRWPLKQDWITEFAFSVTRVLLVTALAFVETLHDFSSM